MLFTGCIREWPAGPRIGLHTIEYWVGIEGMSYCRIWHPITPSDFGRHIIRISSEAIAQGNLSALKTRQIHPFPKLRNTFWPPTSSALRRVPIFASPSLTTLVSFICLDICSLRALSFDAFQPFPCLIPRLPCILSRLYEEALLLFALPLASHHQ